MQVSAFLFLIYLTLLPSGNIILNNVRKRTVPYWEDRYYAGNERIAWRLRASG